MTALEVVGAILLVIGLIGFGVLAHDLWTERGKPPHTHAEGERVIYCRRCMMGNRR